MKILMLNYECPPIGGGAGRIAYYISLYLSLKGHSVIYLTSYFKNTQRIQTVNDNFKIIRINSLRQKAYSSNIFEMLVWALKTIFYLHKNKEIISNYKSVIANFTLPGGLVALYLHLFYKFKYCIISHGHDIPWFYLRKMFFYHLFTYPLIKIIVSKAEYVFVQSNEMFKNALSFVGRKNFKKVKRIYNGVDPNFKIDFQKRTKKDLLNILFVGRLVKQKNVTLLIDALELVKQMNIPFVCYIIGDGKLRRKIQEKISKYKLKNIKLLGWLPFEEIINYYEKSHVFILPSEVEGMSLALIEAMSSGLFIITSKTNQETLMSCNYNYSYVLKILSDFEIAEQIQRYYFNFFLKKNFIDLNLVNQVKEKLSWEKIVNYYEKYLKNCFIV